MKNIHCHSKVAGTIFSKIDKIDQFQIDQ